MDKLLTTEEVAEILGLKPDTVKRLRAKHMGPPYYKLERIVRYNEKEVERWLQTQKITAKYLQT